MILSSACRSFGVSFDASAVKVVGEKRAILRARSGSPSARFCPMSVVESSAIVKTIEMVSFIFLELPEDLAHGARPTWKSRGRQNLFVTQGFLQNQTSTLVKISLHCQILWIDEPVFWYAVFSVELKLDVAIASDVTRSWRYYFDDESRRTVKPIVFDDTIPLFVAKKDEIGNDSTEIA